ncbi:MAG TPA: hypothetical protein VF526_11060 [Solirubrobacteraceae bacterium]
MTARVSLIDDADESGRSTATLLASLAARLGVLHTVSGGQAVGSITAGIAALGREVSATAEGARLRRAIQTGRPAINGEAIWRTLRIGELATSQPPSPVLDQLRNDVALLLADDLQETLELLPIPPEMTGVRGEQTGDTPAEFLDFVVGYWALSREVVQAIEALAAPTLPPAGAIGQIAPPEPRSPLLR